LVCSGPASGKCAGRSVCKIIPGDSDQTGFCMYQIPSNQMDVCLKGVNLSVHDLMQTLSNGFSKNCSGFAEMALETLANVVQNYQDCVKIHVDDVAEWTENHTSQHFQECLSLATQTTTMFVQAIKDKSATEIAAAVQKLDVMGQHCMLE